MKSIILASTSPYRKALLERLMLPFACHAPDADETPMPSESPEALAVRLSEAKARSLAGHFPNSLIIGSDQVITLEGRIFGKPNSYEAAFAQLQASSAQKITVLSGLCLLDTQSGHAACLIEPFYVHMRHLTDAMIQSYLEKEQPYGCAGSIKSEGLGSALFDRLEGDDPTALIGLPLIRLTRLLENAGITIL